MIMKFFKNALTLPICAISVVFAAVLQTNAAVVCYDSHATGANDGTSWADAYTDLQTAVTAAGDGGEVRVKQGVHYPVASAATSITIGNVKLIGGYTGNGEERSTDRRLTVFTGDFNKNDQYVDKDGNVIGQVFDYEKGEFIDFRDWTEAEKYWTINNSVRSDNVQHLFTVASGTTVSDFSQRIEGMTFVGFGTTGVRGSFYTGLAGCTMTMTNCDLVAVCTSAGTGSANVELNANARVQDCGFYGTLGCNFAANASGVNVEMTGCVFRSLYGCVLNLRAVGMALQKGATATVVDTTFDWIYFGTGGAAHWGAVLSINGTSAFQKIDGCTFAHIRSDTWVYQAANPTAKFASLVVTDSSKSKPVTNCVFEDCYYRCDAAVGSMFAGAFSECTFRRNVLIGIAENTTSSLILADANNSGLSNCNFEDNYVEACAPTAASLGGGWSCSGASHATGNVVTNSSLSGNAYLFGSVKSLVDANVEGNVVAAPQGKTACLIYTKSDGAWRTSVVGNTVVGGSGLAAIVDGAGNWINSTFANNRTTGYGADAKAATFYHTGNLFLVHCVVLNNEAPYEAYGYTTSASSRLFLFNSILWRADSDYIAYAAKYPATLAAAMHGLVIRSSAFKGVLADHSEICAYDGYRPVGLLTELGDPLFASTPRTLQDGRKYFILSSKSPYAKVATQILNVKSAACIFKHQDNNQWYDFLSANSGTGMGWSRYLDGKTLTGEEINLPDLQGNERPDTKIAFGVTQELVKPGLMLLLR